jgi:DNA polymerase elongation subunit (family B)
LLGQLASVLPEGIRLELAGRYEAMLSYKVKNYVLLDTEGRLRVRGSGLRSRGIEAFQRRWMEEMFALLLAGRAQDVAAMTRRWEEDFAAHRVPVKQFMKTDTLQESLAGYRDKVAAGKRNAGAPYELALRSGRPYQPGDQVSYYVTGVKPRVKVLEAATLASSWDPATPDENTAYYIGKLRELYERFRPLIEGEGLVPVTEAGETEAALQPELGLEQ